MAFPPTTAPRSPIATGVPGAVVYTGQSRATLYKRMRRGLLPAYKNGTRTILFYEDLDRYMRALARANFRPVDRDEHAAGNSSPAVSSSD
jgi:hypothetical protein